MIGATAITDEQIRDLLTFAKHCGWTLTAHTCRVALGETTAREHDPRIVRDARARCADILNARELF